MNNASKLLINEPALQVLPSLACLVGLNEAIVLQQIHYWLFTAEKTKKIGVYKAGHWWIFNKLEEWRATNFPFWSTKTIQRALDNLRENRVVLVARLSENNLDQTLYYTIDYGQLDRLFEDMSTTQADKKAADSPDLPFGQDVQMDAPFGQDDQIHLDKMTEWDGQVVQMGTSAPSYSPEITSEITQRERKAIPPDECWKMVRLQLEGEMRRADYDQFVKPIVPVGYRDHTFILRSVEFYPRSWCESRLTKKIERLVSATVGEEISVEFCA